SGFSRPFTSATTFHEVAFGELVGVSTRWTLAGPRAARRSSKSASGFESAAHGIFGASSAYLMAPVCGMRWLSVPIERMRYATAPRVAASEAPLARIDPERRP